MQVGLLGLAILAGSATIALLWFHSPVLALICAPFAASLLTGLAALMNPFLRRPTRRSALPTRR
jgi:hypothetical protein